MTMTTESERLDSVNAELDRAANLADEIAGPDDDTTIVDDNAAAEEEKSRSKLLRAVEKIVAADPVSAKKKTPGNDETRSVSEGAAKDPDEFTQELKDRAKEAGIPEGLAQRFHANGFLEEALAAFDRQAIDRTEKGAAKKPPAEKPAKVPENRDGELGEVDLNPEEFDEQLVAVVRQLKAEIASLKKSGNGGVQEWVDKESAKLNPKLFGDAKNRKILREGYERICELRGADPRDCNPDLLKRAYPAMFQDEVFKAAQRETVDRLRGAAGRFIKPTRSSGSPPLRKGMTQEEADAKLMKEVDAIIKR